MKNTYLQYCGKDRGFTLIEVMVTVAIVAILASIALPNYSNYITRGRIPDATAGLATKQVRMEQWFQDNQDYSTSPDCTATDSGTSKYFDFSCSNVTKSTFTLTAAGKGSMSGFTYTVNESNAKQTAALPDTKWGTAPVSCWVTREGGAC